MYKGLNQEQLDAINEEGNVLVIACPGSGKTRVLTLRIAKSLLELDTRKQNIVALTYTNRAADEINHRIEKLSVNIDQLWTGTIHSFCFNWILKPYAGYIDELKNGFKIIDEHSYEEWVAVIKEEFFLSPFLENFTSINRNGDYKFNNNKVRVAAQELHRRLIVNKFIDYDQVLYYSYKLLKTYPKIAKTLGRAIKNFYIDEFQDTQDLQYGIIGEIIKNSISSTGIFIVGDPDQAIYESLGGQAKELSELEVDIGGKIKLLHLSGNYRSSQRIVDLTSNFQTNTKKIKALGENSKIKGKITYNQAIHKEELHLEIARLIKMSLEKGIDESEICVIAPRWNFLTSMARKLKGELPYVSFDAPGLTPLPRNPDNFWYRLARLFLTQPSPKMYLTRLRRVKEIINDLNFFGVCSLLDDQDNCRRMLNLLNSINPNVKNGILYLEKSFFEFFKKLDVDLSDNTLNQQKVAFFTGIERRLEREDFKHLPSDINSFKGMFRQSSGIVVNTCYGVKGEEYETVIAFGLLRGYVPHWNQIIYKSFNEELSASNKLLYVITSRAKSNLHLISETGRLTTSFNAYEPNRQLVGLMQSYKHDSI
jgi:DNA helicase II / ATP-dependent DNA helicase PcrA